MVNLDVGYATGLLQDSLVDGDLLRLLDLSGTVVSGGTYADQAITWAAADSGSRWNSADVVFTGLPTVTVAAFEIWDSTATTRKWLGMIQEQPSAVADPGTSTLHNSNGYADGDTIIFAVAPPGMSPGIVYYVVSSSFSTFQLAATLGGSPLTITATALVDYGTVLSFTAGDSVTFTATNIYLALT